MLTRKFRVKSGQHKGREGNLVSIPWLGNLWNLRMTLNVPSTRRLASDTWWPQDRREWIKVWSWETEECTTPPNPTNLVS
jgi:hypothetical protein